MAEPSTGDPAAVAVALAELRGTMEAGFATVNGSMQLLAHRTDQTDRHIAQLDRRLDAVERGETQRQKNNESRLSTLEAGRWPIRTIGALSGVAGAAAAVVALWH